MKVNETKKEKMLRYLLIVFFIMLVLFGFSFRQEQLPISESTHPPQAIVLHASIYEKENPVIVLYEHKNDQHTLGIYEINKDDHYKFTAKYAVKLSFPIEQLSLDISTNGFWAKSHEEWLYFNPSLQEEERNINTINKNNPYITPFIFRKDEATIVSNEKQSISLNKGETPVELHALSNDQQLWLIVTEKNIKIATITP